MKLEQDESQMDRFTMKLEGDESKVDRFVLNPLAPAITAMFDRSGASGPGSGSGSGSSTRSAPSESAPVKRRSSIACRRCVSFLHICLSLALLSDPFVACTLSPSSSHPTPAFRVAFVLPWASWASIAIHPLHGFAAFMVTDRGMATLKK
jgi:hypothetical protein